MDLSSPCRLLSLVTFLDDFSLFEDDDRIDLRSFRSDVFLRRPFFNFFEASRSLRGGSRGGDPSPLPLSLPPDSVFPPFTSSLPSLWPSGEPERSTTGMRRPGEQEQESPSY
jgi:hypothetical protein